jgi:hypothetical protein
VEHHWLEGQFDRLPALMVDLVRRRMAVIATPAGNLAALAAKARVEQVTFPDLKRGTDLSPLISNRMQCGSMRVPHQGPCDPQDPICAAAHLWSMGHANASHLETFEAIIDVFLVVNVQMRRAFVQKEDSRLSIECSREHHSLLLSA